jgi:hypothetical protein
VCIRVNSDVVKVIMKNIPYDIYDVPLRDNSRIQILEQLEDLPRARKHQYAAFIRAECCLLVWADSASRVIDDAMDIEKKILELIWDDGDSVGRYEKVVEEGDNELELENGYVPPKRTRVLLQPLLVGGVCTFYYSTNIGLDSRFSIYWLWFTDSPPRNCHHWELVAPMFPSYQSNLVLRNGTTFSFLINISSSRSS